MRILLEVLRILLEVFDALWSAQCDVVKECLVKYYELQYS